MDSPGEVKIHVLHCGTIRVSPNVVDIGRNTRLSNTAAQILTPDSRRITLPVSAYLIEHQHGLILVDCGWRRDISPNGVYDEKAARALLSPQLAAFYRPVVEPGQAIHEQLAAMGIKPSDLELVIITHLDPDHVSGVVHLHGARRIIVPEDEYFWSCRTVYKMRQPWKLWIDEPIERVYYRGFPDVPNSWAVDIFGDGTLYMVNLPGHTDGMAGIVAVNGKRFSLMCADAGFNRRSWEELIVPGFGFDEKRQLKSLEWVRDMSRRPGCAAVLASHDADIKPQIIKF
ncbi:MAG: N-acyl homoserine lactonase family protein [Oscillospiraceae bacterium]|nr:N-acyl homoserine lactonase family protein [Oscillospiraceae bacterium]